MRQIARSIRLVSVLALVALGLGSCVSPISIPAPSPPPRPTIGPVRQGSGGPGSPHMELSANTNCAEVGGTVTFTTTITNETTVPITLTGAPLVDIELRPAGPAGPAQRWSATTQYPARIDPVLGPGEARTYQWHWVAEAVYAQQQRLGDNGVWAKLTFGATLIDGVPYPGGSIEVYVGVGSVALAPPGAGVRCKDMQH